MKRFITLSITIALFAPCFSQYSQNLDSVPRKEIKQIVLNQNDSEKAKTLMGVHQGLKYISYISYSFGGISLLSRIHTKREIDKLLTVSIGAIFIGTGLLLTAISKKTYLKAFKEYKRSFQSTNPSNSNIRDDRSAYHSIYNQL